MDAGRKLQSFRHDPCSRHLHKVKELAEKEGVSEELRKEIDRVIELMVVSHYHTLKLCMKDKHVDACIVPLTCKQFFLLSQHLI